MSKSTPKDCKICTLTSDLGLEVIYTYSAVPEPAGVLGSIALLGGGLFFRRRKLAA